MIKGLFFIFINITKFMFIRKIDVIEFDEFTIRGCKRHELKKVTQFLEEMKSNAISSFYKKIIYFLFSEKIIFLVLEKNKENEIKVVGINLYYINFKDLKNSTVHGGYIGVLPMNQGVGIATKLRWAAKKHFYKVGFWGISSRISISNRASLKTAEKMGYVVEYKYYDSSMNEERYYLVCKLRNLSNVK